VPADDPTLSARPGAESLVERRRRYVERMRALANARPPLAELAGQPAARGSGPPNRHGLPKLPPRQRAVRNWPVLDLGDLPRIRREDWRLELAGLVENPVTLDWRAFMELPQVEDESDFHCVTTWSRMDNRWTGVRFAALAELAVPREAARFVATTGYDVAPGTDVPYTTNLALEEALSPDVLLVHAWEGRPLPVEHGGPVRMITPRLYAWKGAKWIRRIEFLADDRPGFWELRGYSNGARPWIEERYA
jgi:DMSO/TMAO reductase YedYZ molybdopterin-dependent catalytic subunit